MPSCSFLSLFVSFLFHPRIQSWLIPLLPVNISFSDLQYTYIHISLSTLQIIPHDSACLMFAYFATKKPKSILLWGITSNSGNIFMKSLVNISMNMIRDQFNRISRFFWFYISVFLFSLFLYLILPIYLVDIFLSKNIPELGYMNSEGVHIWRKVIGQKIPEQTFKSFSLKNV